MNEAQLREVLAITARRIEAAEHIPVDILGHHAVFPQQRNFITDPSKLKCLFCTRRSAKSFTSGLYMFHEALRNPGCNILFVGLTRDSAKGIIWKDILAVLNRTYGCKAVPNKTDLTLTFPNGSVIKVTGVDADESEMLKLLGKKYRLVCIDEASMYTVNLANLIALLKPAMVDPNVDGERGTICMTGTASDFPRGVFYDVTSGKSLDKRWSLHTWTAHDNPHVAKEWQEEIDDIATNNPSYMHTPQYRQWYLNEWVIDQDKLVYRFNPDLNLVKSLPLLAHDGWTRVLGVDLGWEDDNAFVLNGYHVHDPNCYGITTSGRKKMTFDAVEEEVLRYMRHPTLAPHKIIIDGANKQGVESMRARSNIPFEYADKQDKVTFIELFNGDMVQGKYKILDTNDNRPLWEEMAALVWATDGGVIKYPKKEHPALPNHRCDAALYAWRNGYHYHSIKPEKKLITGSREWYQQQADNIWERERERLEAEMVGADDHWSPELDGF